MSSVISTIEIGEGERHFTLRPSLTWTDRIDSLLIRHMADKEREREYYDRWPIQDRKIVVHFALMPACVGGAESLCANCWPLLFAGAEIAARFRIVGNKSSCSKRSTMITDRLGIDRLEKDSSRY